MLEGPWDFFVLYSLLATVCMVSATFLCVCGCKAKERKDELVGIEGHVKMTNSEMLDSVEANGHVGTGLEGERGTSTAKRSLPDLPVDHPVVENSATDVSWEPTGDTASELYATVGIQKCAKPDAATPLTPSEHPYDKLKNVEHPYAQVNKTDAPSTTHEAAEVLPSPLLPPIAATPRQDIAAATAIAGHVHASDDLPYMTPPTHFSGDSQDSAKGYTSISVREPLATIRAETAETRGPSEKPRDRHYATVSDDSDDMYAAIDEPTSGSETYAQIGPPPTVADNPRTSAPPVLQHTHSRQESSSSAASSGVVNSPKPEKRQANSPLPAPPAAGLPDERNLDDMYAKVNKIRRKDFVEEVLERGASTESAMSESSESVSYKLQSNNTSATATDSSQSHSCHGQSTSTSTSMTDSSAPNSRELQLAIISHSTHSCASHSTTDSPSSRRLEASDDSLSSDPDTRASYERLSDNPRYETVGKKDPGYESLEKKDPGYETLDNRNPGYESLNKKEYGLGRRTSDPGYETLNTGDGIDDAFTSEPNYETLGKGPPSDSDPNYERIDRLGHDYASLPHRKNNDGYATVNKDNDEPPYDSLKGHLYATVVKHKNQAKLMEPPYASLVADNGSTEPDYESVQYSSGQIEPPYQLLADFESGNVEK